MKQPPGPSRRWRYLTVIAIAALALSFVYFVLTAQGQALENAALRGADQVLTEELVKAKEGLSRITVTSLAVATVLLGLIGLLRRRLDLAIAAVSVVGVSVVISQVLKRFVLVRPYLVEASEDYIYNSFPSGHTTIAMAALLALLIVSSWRYRPLTLLLATSYALAVGTWTLTAKWHRLSDTVGASAIALGVASLASLWLLRRGAIVRVPKRRRWPTNLLLGFLLTSFLVTLGLGVLLTVLTGVPLSPDETADFNTYLGLTSLATAGSTLTALVFWWSWAEFEVPAG